MVMLYNKSPIMWQSKMQKTTALSTAGAEYYSASAAGCEVLYLRALLDSIGCKQRKQLENPIYEDNTAAVNACIEWGNNVIGSPTTAGVNEQRASTSGSTSPTKSSTLV
jgi:hypothetical protein